MTYIVPDRYTILVLVTASAGVGLLAKLLRRITAAIRAGKTLAVELGVFKKSLFCINQQYPAHGVTGLPVRQTYKWVSRPRPQTVFHREMMPLSALTVTAMVLTIGTRRATISP